MEQSTNRRPSRTLAFIGSVGLPNCYGGFESFLESVAPVMAEKGYRVIVTCDSSRYEDQSPAYRGIEREFVSVPANGPLSQVHDLVAYVKVVRRSDAIVVLGVSAGFFFVAMGLHARLTRKRLLVNVDGIEWRRTKFSRPVRLLLRLFDSIAQLCATDIIYDSPDLHRYVFTRFRKKAHFIAYPGDHVLRIAGVTKTPTALTICRIEPENNIELLVRGALRSKIEGYTIIGNWEQSAFGRNLKSRYRHEPRLTLLDPIYDASRVAMYREQCSIYLHGHSVGGTNPSLVEMLYYDCSILCFDCAFNRSTAGVNAQYFDGEQSLAQQLDALRGAISAKPRQLNGDYSADAIATKYLRHAFALG